MYPVQQTLGSPRGGQEEPAQVSADARVHSMTGWKATQVTVPRAVLSGLSDIFIPQETLAPAACAHLRFAPEGDSQNHRANHRVHSPLSWKGDLHSVPPTPHLQLQKCSWKKTRLLRLNPAGVREPQAPGVRGAPGNLGWS